MQNYFLKTTKNETDIKNELISFCTSCKSHLNSIYSIGMPSFAKENLENCKSPDVTENIINVVNKRSKEHFDQDHGTIKKSNDHLTLDHEFVEGMQSDIKCKGIKIRNGFEHPFKRVKICQKDTLKFVKGYQLKIKTCSIQESHTHKKTIVTTNFIHYRIKSPCSIDTQMYNSYSKSSPKYIDVSSEIYCNNMSKDINNDKLLNGNKINSSTPKNLENQHTTSQYIEKTVRNLKSTDEHCKKKKVHALRVGKPTPALDFKTMKRNTLNRRKNVFNVVNRLLEISSHIENIRETLLTTDRTSESMERKPSLSNKETIGQLLRHGNITKNSDNTNVINTQDLPMYNYNPLHSRSAL